MITGDGVPVGDALVRHPDDPRSSRSTGDVETGKLIARNAARATSSASTSSSAARRRWSCSTTPIPATVAEAIKIGGYWNSGQDCTASSRILVHERIYDDVLVRDGQGASRR